MGYYPIPNFDTSDSDDIAEWLDILALPVDFIEDEQVIEGPTCPICDGLGHGVPGTPPCPLEDAGRFD